jgi:tRNA pseudouridine synthase 9
LHARKYADAEGKWCYETELPEWALPPPGYEGPNETTEESDPLAVVVEELTLKE